MALALVTGANGFIGSFLVRELLRRGHEVRCLVRSTSDTSSIKGLPVSVFVGDIREPETLAAPLAGVEYVYHLAAELMVTDRDAFEQANAQGTANMLEAAEEHAAATIKRFLLVSSQAAAGPSDNPTPLDETAQLKPISWYGTSKKHAEEAARSFAQRLPVTIIRPPSVYGEREKDISQVFELVKYRLQPKLGIKKKYLVMVYVGDLVRGIIEAAESDNTLNETYFLNHPEALTSKQVIKTIAQAAGKPFGLMIPVPLFLIALSAPVTELVYQFDRLRPRMTRDKAREISQRFWVADPSKARRDFGWEAEFTLLEGMKKTVPAHQSEQNEIRAMRLDKPFILWIKYLLCGALIGALIETISYIGRFYKFTPWWTVFIIVTGAFGLALGTLAMLFRKSSSVIQFLVGTIAATLVEVMNYLGMIPYFSWEFAPGWPFGITDPWLRSIVLGMAGGIVVLIVNAMARGLYKRRLRLG